MKQTIQFTLLAIFSLVTCVSYAADYSIKAKIIDTNGESIIGASVKELKTNLWYFSDEQGEILIQTDSNEGRVEVSSLGYITSTFNYSKNSPNIFRLEFDSQNLEDIVVVGYSKQKKINLTGAVENISGKQAHFKFIERIARFNSQPKYHKL